jgi:hypothetical protein
VSALHLFEINFGRKTAQISGFQMKKQRFLKKVTFCKKKSLTFFVFKNSLFEICSTKSQTTR